MWERCSAQSHERGFPKRADQDGSRVKAIAEIQRDFGTLCWEVGTGAVTQLGLDKAIALFVVVALFAVAPDAFGFFTRISLLLGLISFGIIRYRNRD